METIIKFVYSYNGNFEYIEANFEGQWWHDSESWETKMKFRCMTKIKMKI